jgi:hypothetical protein
VQKNAINTSTTNSNLAFEEIFSDKLESNGPFLLSKMQDKKLSQQRLKKQIQKDKHEK